MSLGQLPGGRLITTHQDGPTLVVRTPEPLADGEIPRVGYLELMILGALWRGGPATTPGIAERVGSDQNTVAVTVRRMLDKGYLLAEPEPGQARILRGKRNRYRAAYTRDEFAAAAVAAVWEV